MVIKLNIISLKSYQNEVDAIFVNATLSGSQQRNLEVCLCIFIFLQPVSSTVNKYTLMVLKKKVCVYVVFSLRLYVCACDNLCS